MSINTTQQFVQFVGIDEATQLTQVDNPDIDSIDHAKIQTALDDAYLLLTQKVSPSWALFRISELRVARKLLDPYTQREVVSTGYDEVWQWIAKRNKPVLWI